MLNVETVVLGIGLQRGWQHQVIEIQSLACAASKAKSPYHALIHFLWNLTTSSIIMIVKQRNSILTSDNTTLPWL
jgi:hypothetical protein